MPVPRANVTPALPIDCLSLLQKKNGVGSFGSTTLLTCPCSNGDPRTFYRAKKHIQRNHIFSVMGQFLQVVSCSGASQNKLPRSVSTKEFLRHTEKAMLKHRIPRTWWAHTSSITAYGVGKVLLFHLLMEHCHRCNASGL